VHDKDKYTSLQKTYEVEVIFGVSTDTGDLLGIPEFSKEDSVLNLEDIEDEMKKIVGKHYQPYPMFSSKTVRGKPLFEWAKSDETLLESEIPKKDIEIYSAEVFSNFQINSTDLLEHIEKCVAKISGDFRQEEILKEWQDKIPERRDFQAVKISVSASSGTYMRYWAEKLGEILNSKSCAFSIKRVSVGDFHIQ